MNGADRPHPDSVAPGEVVQAGGRRPVPWAGLALVVVPALMLGGIGMLIASSTPAQRATTAAPAHFAVRQAIAIVVAAFAGVLIARAGAPRMLRLAPMVFLLALLAALAVFIPGVGVRAGGASRWLRLGPLSGAPAPLVTLGVALLMSAWGRAMKISWQDPDRTGLTSPPRRAIAIVLGLLAVATLVREPDFSAAAITLVVGLVALAGLGIRGRRLLPAAAVLVIGLGVTASQFDYVSSRLRGFRAPERNRRGEGYEVLALERATARATPRGVGLGRGVARRSLSSPGSDYVFAVVREELGRPGAGVVIAAFVGIGAAGVVAARRARDRRMAALALSATSALLAPAALHVAVCSAWIPIIGVTMPLVSYDPGATLAAGGELGLIAAVLLSSSSGSSPSSSLSSDPRTG